MSHFPLDRRQLLKGAALGIPFAALPTVAAAANARGFTHGVASGEPSAQSMLLWTRYVGHQDTTLAVELSNDLGFSRMVTGGEAVARAENDWCAKLVVDGLEPWRNYYYRFVAPDGSMSPVGRTRTLPDGMIPSFSMATFSCSNIGYGYFNAYAHAVEVDDIDLVLHLGDYSYEQQPGAYPRLEEAVAGRLPEPARETVALADYRLRYAQYRRDPALQRLHQLFPFVMMWDDHETANDAWVGGSNNHDPATEGLWDTRKRAGVRAYRDWMPVSDEPWRSYEIGELATLFLPETRLTARDRQLDFPGPRDLKAAAQFVAALSDPKRTILGAEQEAWLNGGIAASAKAGKRWQIVAQQVPMGTTVPPPALAGTVPPDAPPELQRFVAGLAMMGKLGLPANLDLWDGYPAARARLLGVGLQAGANLVSLSGDVHNAYAYDLKLGDAPAGIDIACTSVTSPGNERRFAWLPPETLERELTAFNEDLKWHDSRHRGYMRVTLRPDRLDVEHRFSETVRSPSTRLAKTARQSVLNGTNRLASD